MTIPLGLPLPISSSDPTRERGKRPITRPFARRNNLCFQRLMLSQVAYGLWNKYRSPIWSCTEWGLPCDPCYQGSGGLLPHLFTLTATQENPNQR